MLSASLRCTRLPRCPPPIPPTPITPMWIRSLAPRAEDGASACNAATAAEVVAVFFTKSLREILFCINSASSPSNGNCDGSPCVNAGASCSCATLAPSHYVHTQRQRPCLLFLCSRPHSCLDQQVPGHNRDKS